MPYKRGSTRTVTESPPGFINAVQVAEIFREHDVPMTAGTISKYANGNSGFIGGAFPVQSELYQIGSRVTRLYNNQRGAVEKAVKEYKEHRSGAAKSRKRKAGIQARKKRREQRAQGAQARDTRNVAADKKARSRLDGEFDAARHEEVMSPGNVREVGRPGEVKEWTWTR